MNINIIEKINFAEICKEIKNSGKYTQVEMAKKLGVPVRTYRSWEYGQREPNGQCAARILELYTELKNNHAYKKTTDIKI